MKIAYVVRDGFFPPFNGERIKSAALASALADCGDLTVLDTGRCEYPGASQPPRGDRLDLPYGGRAEVFSLVAMAGRSGRPSRPRRRAMATTLINTLGADLVVVDHPTLAPVALNSHCPRRVIHTHNVESQLAQQLADQSGRLKYRLRAWRFARKESNQFPRFDQVWAVSPGDAAHYRNNGLARVEVLPNIVPPAAFEQSGVDPQPGTAAFFGWMAYPPNAEAAAHLLDLVPNIAGLDSVQLIGKGLPETLQARCSQLPQVQATGYVEHLADALQSVSVILIPLLHGAGTKLKVIEALAMGKAVVTTPVGAQGLDLTDGEHALIADPGQDFARASERLLQDASLQRRLGEAGRAHALAHFSLGGLTDRVHRAIHEPDT